MPIHKEDTPYTYGKSKEANDFMLKRMKELNIRKKKAYHEHLFRLDGFEGSFSNS